MLTFWGPKDVANQNILAPSGFNAMLCWVSWLPWNLLMKVISLDNSMEEGRISNACVEQFDNCLQWCRVSLDSGLGCSSNPFYKTSWFELVIFFSENEKHITHISSTNANHCVFEERAYIHAQVQSTHFISVWRLSIAKKLSILCMYSDLSILCMYSDVYMYSDGALWLLLCGFERILSSLTWNFSIPPSPCFLCFLPRTLFM